MRHEGFFKLIKSFLNKTFNLTKKLLTSLKDLLKSLYSFLIAYNLNKTNSVLNYLKEKRVSIWLWASNYTVFFLDFLNVKNDSFSIVYFYALKFFSKMLLLKNFIFKTDYECSPEYIEQNYIYGPYESLVSYIDVIATRLNKYYDKLMENYAFSYCVRKIISALQYWNMKQKAFDLVISSNLIKIYAIIYSKESIKDLNDLRLRVITVLYYLEEKVSKFLVISFNFFFSILKRILPVYCLYFFKNLSLSDTHLNSFFVILAYCISFAFTGYILFHCFIASYDVNTALELLDGFNLTYIIIFFFLNYFICVLLSFFFMLFFNLRGVFMITNSSLFFFWLSLMLNLKNFFFLNECRTFSLFKWFKLNENIQVFFEIYLDNVSYSFMLLTTTIALFVNFYAFNYFKNELNVEKFILFLNSFVLSMLILLSAGNLIVFFLGWELIGITSFLLINFWYNRPTTFKSAFKAFSFNKSSDCFIFFSMFILCNSADAISFSVLVNSILLLVDVKHSFMWDLNSIEVVSFFFLSAAFVKSAQIGFHIWLPDSMEAPVPASALIHSATLVSAGIFLIIRLYPIFELSNYFFFIISLVGSITAFVGGVSASVQTDLKKILAYSTISHCGFLMFLLSFGDMNYVLIYLFIHGFFKASAFLSAGNIIKFAKGYQDIRRMGQFWKYLTADLFFLSFSLANLGGLPFFFGFYIKHCLFICEDYIHFKLVCGAFLLLGALSGVFYSFRIIYYVFFDTKKARKSVYFNRSTSNFKSDSYTNSSIASHLAIVGLFFFCVLYFFYIFILLLFKKLFKHRL